MKTVFADTLYWVAVTVEGLKVLLQEGPKSRQEPARS